MMLKTVRKWDQATVIVDVDYPGVLIPDHMRTLVQGTKLTIDLTTQAPRLKFDSKWLWFQFGSALKLGHIPSGAVTLALDRATGAVLTYEKTH